MLSAVGTTAAQTVEQSDLDRCARQETAELKLACFEALASPESTDAEATAEATAEPTAEEAAESTANTAAKSLPETAVTEKELVAPAVTAGAAASAAGSGVEPVAPVVAPGVQYEQVEETIPDEKVAADSAVDNKDAEMPVAMEASADQLGSEHLDEEKVEKEEADADIRMTVTEVVKGNYDVLYFHLANGQIWRQIEPRRFSYPRKGEFEVVISRGMMRDYRLRVAGNSPMTTIRRLQ